MTVRDDLQPRPAEEPIPHHWTLGEYHRAIDAGVFGDRRVELLHGEIVEMPPMNDPHIGAVRYLAGLFFVPALPGPRVPSTWAPGTHAPVAAAAVSPAT
jgi:hypothetical protein